MNAGKIVIPLLMAGASMPLAAQQNQQPNVLVILADDLGFSDLGCFGGEIKTPNLDKLGNQGVRYTQMYNSARSCPSRACILTGLYPHQVGVGEMIGGGQKKQWPIGYSGFRDDNNMTIAEVFKENGYYTAMSGKWHLGNNPGPFKRGFQDYYGLVGGFTTFWDQTHYTRLPNPETVRQYPEGEFYATNAITDYAVEFVDNAKNNNEPFFMYLAYNAPHFPLHAPKEKTDEYMETYLRGWDVLREERDARIRELGLLQNNPEMSPRGITTGQTFTPEVGEIPAWDALTSDQQKDLARRMAIYAAMVDIMDENIGRLLAQLEANGQLDNTLIMFMSDNGACAEWHEFGFDYRTGVEYHTHVGDELDQMGLPGTYHHYGTGWANLCNTPLRLYKHYAHEGGISTPGIMWWGDKVKNKGAIDYQPCHFTDIMATCLDAANIKYPKEYKDRELLPLEGVSILPMLTGDKIKARPIFAEHEGNRMVRIGDWKLVGSQFDGLEWQLYNIYYDRTEQHDLADKYPDRVKQMAEVYFEWADRSNVLPYAQMRNEYSNDSRKMEEFKDR